MNEQALESFISVCDKMMIPVEEGFKINPKDIMTKIKEILNRILTMFKELANKVKNKLRKAHTESKTTSNTEAKSVNNPEIERYIKSMYEVNNLAVGLKNEITKYIMSTISVATTIIKTGTANSDYKASSQNIYKIIEKIHLIINNLPNVSEYNLKYNEKYFDIMEKILNDYDDSRNTIQQRGEEVVDTLLNIARTTSDEKANLIYPITTDVLDVMRKFVAVMSSVINL